LHLDVVLADPREVADPAALERACALFDAQLVLRPLACSDGSARHDPVELAAAFTDILGRGRIGPWR
jgi:hypothetical protein